MTRVKTFKIYSFKRILCLFCHYSKLTHVCGHLYPLCNCVGAVLIKIILVLPCPKRRSILVISIVINQHDLGSFPHTSKRTKTSPLPGCRTQFLHTGWERAGLSNSLIEESGLKSFNIHSFSLNRSMYIFFICWVMGRGGLILQNVLGVWV